MGYKMMIAALVLVVSSMASASYAGLELTAQQQQSILDNLNNICGDAWCEGEYELNFVSIRFREERGVPQYVLSIVAHDSYMDRNQAPRINFECVVKDVQVIQEMVNPNAIHPMSYLEHKLYQNVDDCVLDNLYKK